VCLLAIAARYSVVYSWKFHVPGNCSSIFSRKSTEAVTRNCRVAWRVHIHESSALLARREAKKSSQQSTSAARRQQRAVSFSRAVYIGGWKFNCRRPSVLFLFQIITLRCWLCAFKGSYGKNLSARKTKGVLKQTKHCWYVVREHIMKKCGCDTEPHFCVFVLHATQQPMEVNFTVHKVARAVKMESQQPKCHFCFDCIF